MFDVAIIGAGPAGLAAATESIRHGASVVVVEKLDQVGGLARTLRHGDCRFDIGPHRFYTKNVEVQAFFEQTVGADIHEVRRLTRILFREKLFHYPLSPFSALRGVGLRDSAHILGSFGVRRLARRLSPRKAESFEDWVSDEFGSRLYELFFKTYTEKVWGISCSDIGAEWASQRIKGVNLLSVIRNALGRRDRSVKSLIDSFLYPRLGSGQFYEKLAADLEAAGGHLRTGATVTALRRDGGSVRAIRIDGPNGTDEIEAKRVFFSNPLTEAVQMAQPAGPPEVQRAASSLRYREHIGVHLIFEGESFPNNRIYVHSRDVRMARVTNHSSFSAAMTRAKGIHPLTVEYFCFAGDDLWSMRDESLIALAQSELRKGRVLAGGEFLDGFVVRSEKAYPVIERGYERHLAVLRAWIESVAGLYPIGRSGMFRYNNQDHAIATGLLTARTAFGAGHFDPWKVNIDGEYIEEEELR